MRRWQHWWERLLWLVQYDPPRFIESLMLGLAIVLLLVWQVVDSNDQWSGGWAYLVLSLGYAIGSALSILVRETLISLSCDRTTIATALVLLSTSSYVLLCVFINPNHYL